MKIEIYILNTKKIMYEINNGNIAVFEIPSEKFGKLKGSLVSVFLNEDDEQTYKIVTGNVYKHGDEYNLDDTIAEDISETKIRERIESLYKKVKENKGRVLFRERGKTFIPDIMGFINWIKDREKK